MELVKPESDPSQGNVTLGQRGVVCEEQRGVVTEKQSGLVAVEERDVVNEEQAGVFIEDGRGVVHINLSGQSNAGEPKGITEFLLKVTERIQSTLREKRQKCDRPEELHVSWPCMYMHTYMLVWVSCPIQHDTHLSHRTTHRR